MAYAKKSLELQSLLEKYLRSGPLVPHWPTMIKLMECPRVPPAEYGPYDLMAIRSGADGIAKMGYIEDQAARTTAVNCVAEVARRYTANLPQALSECLDALVAQKADEITVFDLVHSNFAHTNIDIYMSCMNALKKINTPKSRNLALRITEFWTPNPRHKFPHAYQILNKNQVKTVVKLYGEWLEI